MPASLRTDLAALTAEQAAALCRYRDQWTAIRRATDSADRSAAEAGVRLAYQAASLEPPRRLVWCGGPIELADLTTRLSRADGANVKSAVIDGVQHRVASTIKRRVRANVRATVANAINIADPLTATASDAVMRSATHSRPPLLMRIRRAFSLSSLARHLIARSGFRDGAVGQHDLAWLAIYEYFHDVCGLQPETEPLRGLWLFAKNAGWILPHERVCWLAERHSILSGDARNRLHSAKGPAIQYPDGWSFYAWKGVQVPAWIIEQPERITLQAIETEPHVQVRRCMIEIMTPQRYVAEGGALRVAEDETGVLWRKTWWGFDNWAAVEVIDATPGPDGTHKHHFLQVPAQMRTPRQAVAWTYGLTVEQYGRLTLRT